MGNSSISLLSRLFAKRVSSFYALSMEDGTRRRYWGYYRHSMCFRAFDQASLVLHDAREAVLESCPAEHILHAFGTRRYQMLAVSAPVAATPSTETSCTRLALQGTKVALP